MKKYTCTKPCTIGGQRFVIGNDVPAELIAPGRERAILDYGLVSVTEISDQQPETNPPDDDGDKQPEADDDGKNAPSPDKDDGDKQHEAKTDSNGKTAKEKKVNK